MSLLSVVYKLFPKIPANRIRTTFELYHPKEQAGFRAGYQAIGRIRTINQAIEKFAEYNQPLHIAFIGYEKAFDSVEISAVMQALWNQSVSEIYINILEEIYSGSIATMVLRKERDKIPIKEGVSQGDTISPMVFTACLQEVFKLARDTS